MKQQLNLVLKSPLYAVAALSLMSTAKGAIITHYSFDSDFSLTSGSYGGTLSTGGGTPNNTSTAGEFVFGGGALNLDKASDEYLSLSSEINFATSDTWSVSFWARRRPGAAIATGMALGDNTTTDSFIWLPDNSSQVQGMRFRPAGVGSAGGVDYATGHDTDFHHWVVVADGAGTIRAYRDNVDLGTGSPSGGSDFDINSIGSGYTGTNQIFDGQIDELYIFDESIDAATVNSLYTSNAVPEPSTLALIGLAGLSLLTRRRRA